MMFPRSSRSFVCLFALVGCTSAGGVDDGARKEDADVDGRAACDDCSDIAQARDGGFLCDDGTDLLDAYLCDGLDDCPGGEDEADAACLAEDASDAAMDQPFEGMTFTCPNGDVLPGSWRCDGVGDCADGADEFYCPTPEAPINGDGGFVCSNGPDITDDWVCDGFPDCPEADDEASCDDAGVGDAGTGDGGLDDAGPFEPDFDAGY